jgi:uncharacterized protein (DUF1800 family)
MRNRLLPTAAVFGALAFVASAGTGSVRAGAAPPTPTDDRTIVHVLNRIGFGARPGDVAAVKAMGLDRYIDQQLHPERMADAGMDPRLSGLTTVRMSTQEIATKFEIPQMQARRERQLQAMRDGDGRRPANNATQPRDRSRPANDATPVPMLPPGNDVMLELMQQKVLRAVYSERQLQEVLADFWFNHFNVDMRKNRDRFLLTEYERDVIRPHVLGKFRDLLGATAKSAAMLFYLDNWMSVYGDGSRIAGRATRVPMFPERQLNRARGLNENYGRELMELHTLGVDGGYTQKDVTEVARAFTGWTIASPRDGSGFRFDARFHDPGEKVVLGHRIKAGGGERDGEQVLDILASHPSTARFIATKLVRRFVSDTLPASLVDRAAATFRQTGGDLREVMRTILTSPEFLSPDAYRAKVKTPLEFVVSAVRATGASVDNAVPLVRTLQELGMPLYACQPPTGYKDTADAWVNAGALVNRMNFAVSLAGNQLRGITVTPRQSSVSSLLNDDVSEATRSTIARAATDAQMAALTLGSPEFQRR